MIDTERDWLAESMTSYLRVVDNFQTLLWTWRSWVRAPVVACAFAISRLYQFHTWSTGECAAHRMGT